MFVAEVVHILSSDDDDEEEEDPLGSASKKTTNTPMSPAKQRTRKSKVLQNALSTALSFHFESAQFCPAIWS